VNDTGVVYRLGWPCPDRLEETVYTATTPIDDQLIATHSGSVAS